METVNMDVSLENSIFNRIFVFTYIRQNATGTENFVQLLGWLELEHLLETCAGSKACLLLWKRVWKLGR